MFHACRLYLSAKKNKKINVWNVCICGILFLKHCFHLCIGVSCHHACDLHSCLLHEIGLNILPILTLGIFRPVSGSEHALERYWAAWNLGFWGQILHMHYVYFWSSVSLWKYGLAIGQPSSKKCCRIYNNFEWFITIIGNRKLLGKACN